MFSPCRRQIVAQQLSEPEQVLGLSHGYFFFLFVSEFQPSCAWGLRGSVLQQVHHHAAPPCAAFASAQLARWRAVPHFPSPPCGGVSYHVCFPLSAHFMLKSPHLLGCFSLKLLLVLHNLCLSLLDAGAVRAVPVLCVGVNPSGFFTSRPVPLLVGFPAVPLGPGNPLPATWSPPRSTGIIQTFFFPSQRSPTLMASFPGGSHSPCRLGT